MIIAMPTTARPQQRYDHRLRNLVQRTGDVTVATNLGVPRSTARGWLGAAPTVVVCLDVADLTEPQEVLKLRRRVQKLAALLRLAVSLLRTSGFRFVSMESVCRTDAPKCGSDAPWIGPTRPRFANGLAVPADVTESVRGAGGNARVRATIRKPRTARRPTRREGPCPRQSRCPLAAPLPPE
jgi:hypothetical protein